LRCINGGENIVGRHLAEALERGGRRGGEAYGNPPCGKHWAMRVNSHELRNGNGVWISEVQECQNQEQEEKR